MLNVHVYDIIIKEISMSEIYDSVFRTLINDCKQRLPFVLNEVFGENYDGTETVTFHPNEHFISRYD